MTQNNRDLVAKINKALEVLDSSPVRADLDHTQEVLLLCKAALQPQPVNQQLLEALKGSVAIMGNDNI